MLMSFSQYVWEDWLCGDFVAERLLQYMFNIVNEFIFNAKTRFFFLNQILYLFDA